MLNVNAYDFFLIKIKPLKLIKIKIKNYLVAILDL